MRRLERVIPGLLAAFAAVVFASPVSAQSVRAKSAPTPNVTTRSFAIPFDYAPPLHPFIVVHARINGSEPLPFIINTGLNSEVTIYPATARKAGLKPRPSDAKAKPVPGAPLSIGRSTVTFGGRGKESLSINIAQTYQVERPAILNDYGTTEIAGMIGARFLLAQSSRLDFNTRTWTLYGPTRVPRPLGQGKVWAVPLAKDSALPMATISARDRSGTVIAEQAAYLHTAQTGNGLLLPQPGSFADLPYAQGDFARMGPTGVVDSVRVVLLPSLSIGDAPLSDVELSLSSAFSHAYVGLDVLKRFRVTVSAPDRMLYMEERPGFPHPLLGRTGITLDQRVPGLYYCLTVPPPLETKTKTDIAPLRIGDRLLAIDGRNITGMPFWRADMLLNSYAGTSARLKVQTESEPPRTVIVPRRHRFTSPTSPAAQVILGTRIQSSPSTSRHQQ